MRKKSPRPPETSIRLRFTEEERYRLRVKTLRNKTTIMALVRDFLLEYIKDEPYPTDKSES